MTSIRIAVNIAGQQFAMPNFVEMVGNILAETGIAAAIINGAAGIADGESGVRRPASFDAWLASPVATEVCSPPSPRCPFPARAARGVTLALA